MTVSQVWESDEYGLTITLTEDLIATVSEHCDEAGAAETGGVLAGAYNPPSEAMVTGAMGPPADSVATRRTFTRGTDGVEEWLAEAHEDGLNYVGEWHYHPEPDPTPSADDKRAMLEIAGDESYGCPTPILLIVTADDLPGYGTNVSVANVNEGFEELTRA